MMMMMKMLNQFKSFGQNCVYCQYCIGMTVSYTDGFCIVHTISIIIYMPRFVTLCMLSYDIHVLILFTFMATCLLLLMFYASADGFLCLIHLGKNVCIAVLRMRTFSVSRRTRVHFLAKMEEHVDQDGSQATPVVDDNTALLNVNNDELSRGCSRAVHCCLALPFLAIIALVIISVACFYNNQDHVGGCVLFGEIDEGLGLFKHGPNAVCLTVTGGEMVLCAFAILYAIVLVVKSFLSSRL